MKRLATFLAMITLARLVDAGESALTTTYQPLDGLGSGRVTVVPVTCHQYYAGSGVGSAVDLIHLRNVPPTDHPAEANQDLNLASRCGLKFSTNDLGLAKAPPKVVFDALKFDASKGRGYQKEEIVRASLECLRRCLPGKLKTTRVTLLCRPADRKWLGKMVLEFNAASKDLIFFRAE